MRIEITKCTHQNHLNRRNLKDFEIKYQVNKLQTLNQELSAILLVCQLYLLTLLYHFIILIYYLIIQYSLIINCYLIAIIPKVIH
jgi:hypothetical protein